MSRSARGVAALVAATIRVDELTALLDTATKEVRRLEEVELPAAFTEDGLSELRLPDGTKAGRDVSVTGSFPSPTADRPDAVPRYEAAKAWVIANGHQDSLRAIVAANYGAGEREAALAAYERLRGDNRAHTTITETVHHSTLRGIVRDRIKRALPTPAEELGCVVIRRVKLTAAPRRPLVVDEDRSVG